MVDPDGIGSTEPPPRKKKRGAPLWAKLAVSLGALLMMVSGGALVGVRTLLGSLEDSIQIAQPGVLVDPSESAAPDADGKVFDGAFDVLLLGIDTRATMARTDARADTIMMLHVPETHDQAYLMSIPRDVRVEIPGHGHDKINGAFTAGLGPKGDWQGGLKLMVQTIKKLTDIDFEAAMVIDFAGFRKVIDALGRVDLCVEADVKSIHFFTVDGKPQYVPGMGDDAEANRYVERTGNKRFVHHKGCRDMAGWEALDFARQRYGLKDSDYGRQRHQQQLIKAMAKKAGSAGVLTDFGKVNALVKAVGESMLLSMRGNMTVTDFLFTMKDLATADLVLLKTNSGDFNGIKVNGISFEELDKETMDMFRAAKNDKLGNYVLLNPQVVNNEK